MNGLGNAPTGYYQSSPFAGTGGSDGLAFHAGGVAACDGCHVMHNAGPGPGAKSTIGGQGEPAWSNYTNAYLLQGSDQSSTCLLCHGGGATATVPAAGPTAGNQFLVADLVVNNGVAARYFTPGGDFGWLSKTFTDATTGVSSPGQVHGHNVVARDFAANGFVGDTRFSGVAPGGTFRILGDNPWQNFACSSCHDPHGRYRMQPNAAGPNGIEFAGPSYAAAARPIAASGSYGDIPGAAGSAVTDANVAVGTYRLLAGRGYEPASKPGVPFPNDPPTAVSPRNYNKDEATTETRVMYGTGMSEWCKNCHPQIHQEGYISGMSGQRHPAASTATLRDAQVGVYNTYISSGVSGASQARYTSLVPFEQGRAISLSTFKTMAAPGEPTGNVLAKVTDNVMCLSCHRAHATAFDSMIRWDQNATFLTGVNAYTGGVVGRDLAITQAGYYNRPASALGNYQRSLCNKCHGKD